MSKLAEILKDKKNFWLGPIVKVHRIGEYQLVEYKDKEFRNCVATGKLSGTRSYSIYINEESTSHSASSLDAALADAMTLKHLGPNSQAGYFFMKMLKTEQ